MKTIYYAFVQKLDVPDNATEEEIDDLVFEKIQEPVDYIWSEKPNLFYED